MKSIVGQLGNQVFPRLRVGIDHPPAGWDTVGYVLGRFTADEAASLPDIYDRVADAVEVILREGFVAAMNKYNV
jgi:PTH1 family peptidyl-tRNA hydrolase